MRDRYQKRNPVIAVLINLWIHLMLAAALIMTRSIEEP